MRLADRERELIACLELRADAQISAVSKATGFRRHTVQHYLNRLRQRGILAPQPIVDVGSLGYQEFAVYFNIAAPDRRRADKLFDALAGSERVTWLVRFAGRYELGMGVLARSSAELAEVLGGIVQKAGASLADKTIVSRGKTTFLERRYLTRRRYAEALVWPTAAEKKASVTEHDIRILSALANTEYASYAEIAARLAMPMTTLCYRIRQLQAKRVIAGWILDCPAISLGMQGYRMLVGFKEPSAAVTSRLSHFCSEHPYVVRVVETVGGWDCELQFEAPSGESAATLLNDFAMNVPCIESITTLAVLKESRLSSFPVGLEDVRSRAAA